MVPTRRRAQFAEENTCRLQHPCCLQNGGHFDQASMYETENKTWDDYDSGVRISGSVSLSEAPFTKMD